MVFKTQCTQIFENMLPYNKQSFFVRLAALEVHT